MSAAWTTVAAVGLATIALKAVAPLALGGRSLPERLSGMLDLMAPALLSALVVTQTFGVEERLVLDPRAAGVGAAALAILMRAPVLATVVLAAVVTAALRAMT